MKKLLLLLLLIVSLFCVGALAQKAKPKATPKPVTKPVATANSADIKAIDTYVKSIEALVKRSPKPHLIFADTASQESSRSRWRKFASEKALEAQRAKSETYEIAYCWLQAGKVVETSTTLFSGSGDWAQYVYHYYRPDGTLAKVESDFRSFNGDIIIEKALYYNKAGKQIKTTTQYRDLTTRKFKKVDPKSGIPAMGKFEVYKTVKKLPFAHLLAQK